jgi:threonine dehydrogenase-like Zn-dependent dehydrogenase
VVAFDVACGKCPHCLRGEFTGCEKTNPSKLIQGLYGHGFAGILGFAEIAGGYSGAQAEYIRVPYGDVGCMNIPDTIPDDVALYLSDVACTSYHAAIDLGQVKKDDNVAIWGSGPIGILSAKWCEIFGAKNIYIIDNVPDRMALVQSKVGRVHLLNFDEVTCVDYCF